MAELPTGAKFGSLVHAVLGTADPEAADLQAELAAQIQRHAVWWPVDVPAEELAAALVPLHDTPLGPLAGNRTLPRSARRIGCVSWISSFPCSPAAMSATGVRAGSTCDWPMSVDCWRWHLPAGDPLTPTSTGSPTPALGGQHLRGYLNGSLDVVLRVPDGAGHRYLVADYKTNWLGDADRPLTSADYSPARIRLSVAGAAVLRCAASLSALATARL